MNSLLWKKLRFQWGSRKTNMRKFGKHEKCIFSRNAPLLSNDVYSALYNFIYLIHSQTQGTPRSVCFILSKKKLKGHIRRWLCNCWCESKWRKNNCTDCAVKHTEPKTVPGSVCFAYKTLSWLLCNSNVNTTSPQVHTMYYTINSSSINNSPSSLLGCFWWKAWD